MEKPIYLIEHLEPEVFEWCLIEYEHISQIVGKENLWVTNLKTMGNAEKLKKFGKVFLESVRNIEFDRRKACILDPDSEKTLSPSDSKIFDYYIFGGILGDFPPKKRTKKELTKFMPECEKRDIGKEQMSTDNAVYTVKQIIENGKNFEELPFTDEASIEINDFETVELPYRYNFVGEKGKEKPLMSSKIVEYLKNKQGF